jgi:hypothetical protein
MHDENLTSKWIVGSHDFQIVDTWMLFMLSYLIFCIKIHPNNPNNPNKGAGIKILK